MALLVSMKRSVEEEEAEDGLIVPKKVLYTPTHPLWLYPHFFVCVHRNGTSCTTFRSRNMRSPHCPFIFLFTSNLGFAQWNCAFIEFIGSVVKRREYPQLNLGPLDEQNKLVRQAVAGMMLYASDDFKAMTTAYLISAHYKLGLFYEQKNYRVFLRKLSESAQTGLTTCMYCLLNNREESCRECSK